MQSKTIQTPMKYFTSN